MQDEEQALHKKLNLLIVVLCVVVLGIIISFFVVKKHAVGSDYLSAPFAQNLTYPYLMDSQNLYFYTGHGFADLDTSTLKTKQLGGLHVLPQNPSSVQWYKDGAIIRTANYQLSDELGISLANVPSTGGSSSPAYLWYMPYDGPLITIDGNVTSSYTDQANGVVYYVQQGDYPGSTFIKSYNIQTQQTTTLKTPTITSDIALVYASNGTVYALTDASNGISLVKYSGNQSVTTLVTNPFNNSQDDLNQSFAMGNDHYAVLLRRQDSGNADDLVTYNIDSGKFQTVAANFQGTINQASAGAVSASGTNGNKVIFTSFTSAQDYHATSVIKATGNVSTAFALSASKLLYIDYLSKAYIVSSNQADTENLPVIKATGLDKAIAPSNDYTVGNALSNAANGNGYDLFLADPASASGAEFTQNALTAGYDPNQLDLTILNQL